MECNYYVLELQVFCQLIRFHHYMYFHIIFPMVSPQRKLNEVAMPTSSKSRTMEEHINILTIPEILRVQSRGEVFVLRP